MNDSAVEIVAERNFMADRQLVDFVEIGYLSLSVCLGTLLNSVAVVRLLRYSRSPSAKSHCLLRPLHMNSFSMLKFNLAITDFAILLIHALGKMVWLLSYRWLFGDFGCRLYQFLSAFAYYSNSNVVVAIGLDRLKVVYSGRVQGTSSSIRRVRVFLCIAWALAAICALPQLFFWTNFELGAGWSQCTTIWQIAAHSQSNTDKQQWHKDWSVSQNTQMLYELLHQVAVFVIPFISLSASYLLIVLRVLRYTLHPPSSANFCSSYSSYNGMEQSAEGQTPHTEDASPNRLRKRSTRVSWHLRKLSSARNFLHLLQHHHTHRNSAQHLRVHMDPSSASPKTTPCRPLPYPDINGPGVNGINPLNRRCAAPPSSPNAANNAKVNGPSSSISQFPHFSADYSSVDLLLAHQPTRRTARVPRRCSAMESYSVRGTEDVAGRRHVEVASKRCSLNAVVEEAADPAQVGPERVPLGSLHPANGTLGTLGQCASRHRLSLGKPSIASTAGAVPLWRRQLRSKVFIRSLLIVVAHCAFWLPYNLLNLLRFTDERLYTQLVDRGALLVEDLIVMNSLINPVLYGYGK